MFKKNNQFLFFCFYFVLVISLSSCGKEKPPVEFSSGSGDNKAEELEEIKSDNQEIIDRKKTLSKLIFESGFDSPEYYKQIEDLVKSVQSQIITNDAAKNKDIDKCEQLDNETLMQNCKDVVLSDIAIGNEDVNKCDEIKNKFRMEGCKNQIYVTKAVSAADETICEKVTNQFLKQNCINNAIFAKAIGNLDVEMCEKLENDSRKTNCKREIEVNIKNAENNNGDNIEVKTN